MGLLAGQLYAKDGYNVALVDINKEALDKCVAEIAAYPANVIGIAIDIRDCKKVEEARDKTVEAFGSIDILINFASAIRSGSLWWQVGRKRSRSDWRSNE